MKPLSIFIDHTSEDNQFVETLKKRLGSIQDPINIVASLDLSYHASWRKVTLEAMDEAEIIIPILSANYLSCISNDLEFESAFDNAVNGDDKFVFPILLRPADWGSFNWIVRSNIIPSDSEPLSEYSDNDQDRILNNLIKTISNISAKRKLNLLQNQKKKKSLTPAHSIIFISHDHEDGDFAELLKLRLEKDDLSAWIDNERLKIGQDWREEIDQNIEDSIAVIAVMTPNSRKSEYVTYEWAFAWGKGKKIFPIMLKQTQLHPRLESLQYLDFTNRSSRPWDKLIASIKEL